MGVPNYVPNYALWPLWSLWPLWPLWQNKISAVGLYEPVWLLYCVTSTVIYLGLISYNPDNLLFYNVQIYLSQIIVRSGIIIALLFQR